MRQRTDRTAPAAAAPRAHQARGAAVAPPSVPAVLAEPGAPLPPQLQSQASRFLGFDVSSARVHAGLAAAESAREMAARAYTVRPHLVFAHGKYEPDTARGQALLLHELGHFHQQSEHDPRAPLQISRSHAHEANADLLARRMAAPLAMDRNHLACSPEASPEPDGPSLAEPAPTSPAASHPPAPAPTRLEPATSGAFAGATYRINADGNYEVTFTSTPLGRIIIEDFDDPEKPASVKLSNGERASQVESKRLTVHNAKAVAVYRPEHVALNARGEAIGIRKLKPIAVDIDLRRGGFIRQYDGLKTTTETADATPGARATPSVDRTQQRDRVITGGIFRFSKQPLWDSVRRLWFEKFERSRAIGSVVRDRSTNTVYDHSTKLASKTTANQTSYGVTEAGKGRSTPDSMGKDAYVLINESSAVQSQNNQRVDVTPLPSGRTVEVVTPEVKDNVLPASTKGLTNVGTEAQPDRQKEDKGKLGSELTDKAGGTVTIYRDKPPAPGTEGPAQRIVVSKTRNVVATAGQAGYSRQIVHEGRKIDKEDKAAATRAETGLLAGGTGAVGVNVETARGLVASNLSASYGLGASLTHKRGAGPDVAPASVKPNAGQSDIINYQRPLAGDKATGNYAGFSANVTDTTATVAVEGAVSKGYEVWSKPDVQSAWSIFTIDTIYSGTNLAGYHLEGKFQGQATRGAKDAVIAAGQLGASLSGTLQIGNLSERGVEFIVRPDRKKVSHPAVLWLLDTVDPTFDLKLKAHSFAGVELKGEAGVTAGKDVGKSLNVGASATAGWRLGGEIDGSIQVGQPIGVAPPREGQPRPATGARFGSVKGSFAAVLGASAAWRSTWAYIGGRLVAGGEGSLAFPIGTSGSMRAELDLWKLATIGISAVRNARDAGRKIAAWWRSDALAVQQVRAGAHASLDLTQRAALLDTLLSGHTDEAEQAAIVTVLADARRRFDFFQLVGKVGNNRLWLALDGKYNQQYQALRQTP